MPTPHQCICHEDKTFLTLVVKHVDMWKVSNADNVRIRNLLLPNEASGERVVNS